VRLISEERRELITNLVASSDICQGCKNGRECLENYGLEGCPAYKLLLRIVEDWEGGGEA